MVWLIKSCTANVKLYHNINLEGIKNFEEEEILKRSKRNIYGSISRYHYTNHDGKLLLVFYNFARHVFNLLDFLFASWLLGSANDNGPVRKRQTEKNQTESSENQETLENLEFPVYGLETTEFSDPQTDEGSR